MNIKLILSDLDGTLLDSNKKLPKDFDKTLKILNSKNIIFGIASGRQYQNIYNKFNQRKDLIYIGENGGIAAYQGEIIHFSPLNKEIIPEIIDQIRKLENCCLVLCGKQKAYVETTEEKYLKECREYYFALEIVNDLKLVQDDICKLAILDFAKAENNSYQYLKKYQKDYQVTVSASIWLDFFDKDTSKGAAVEKIQKLLNIKPEETMVFGDYLNDVEMLKKAKYSFAMANSHPQLFQVSNYRCPSNDENGVVKTINAYLNCQKVI